MENVLLKIGDSVEITNRCSNTFLRGEKGEVVTFCGVSVGIKFEKKFNFGHDCNQSCEFGFGWFVEPEFIDRISNKNDGIKPTVENEYSLIMDKIRNLQTDKN